MFIGRKIELNELKEAYDSNKNEFISVLGRRRVGKSQLIFNSQKDFKGLIISYECSDTGYKNNLLKIENLVKEKFNNEYLHFDSFFDILCFLNRESYKQKILFVIDEYPYMRQGKETDSEIKSAIDKFDLEGNKGLLKFVICGSSVQIMNVLDDVNMPLHGRFSKVIRLFPLSYLESSLFYSHVSNEDKVKYYAVLGGVPYYLKQIKPNLSFDENIINLFFASNALLKTEIENQIYGEINKIDNASFILNILKDKTLSYTDIKQTYKSLYKNVEIDYLLIKLQEMKIIEKVFVEQNNGIKKPYYRIIDNSFVFYFSFLNESFANRLLFSDKQYYNTFIKEKLNTYFIPHMFEKICYEFISFMNINNRFSFRLLDLFQYIYNDKQNKRSFEFDVVGKTSNGLINFECEFQDNPITKTDIEKETNQSVIINKNFIKTIFISKSKVETKDYYSLNDVFDISLLG